MESIKKVFLIFDIKKTLLKNNYFKKVKKTINFKTLKK